MNTDITIQEASAEDVQELAIMVGELLSEIMEAIGIQAFHFDLGETTARLRSFIDEDKYFVFVALDESEVITGFLALYESYALYAEGAFGTIPELYVRPEYRSKHIGLRLISRARSFATSKGWKRIEVTTPPLPQFNETLAFYERGGFAITGGRKLKIEL